MFDLLLNVKTRTVISQITLDQFVNSLKNPSDVTKLLVDEARTLEKEDKRYKTIKENLHCIVPIYNHTSYVNISSISKGSGFIYIDVDDNSDEGLIPSDYPFIAAKWKSLSGKGSGYLVSVSNLNCVKPTKEYIQEVVIEVSKVIGVNPDLEAISRDRLNVIGYDTDVYYNKDYSTYTIKAVDSVEDNKVTHPSPTNNTYNRLLVDDHFYSEDLRMSNIDEIVSKFSFESDEVFKDLGKDKLKYSEVFIPEKIYSGSRNSKLFKITSLVYGLNPNITYSRLYGYALKVNRSVCETPLSDEEISYIVKKICKREPELFSNKEKRFLFNSDYMLTGKERTTIAVTESNLQRGIDTTKDIINAVENWDFEVLGKINYKKIARLTNKSYSTVRRRKEEVENMVNILNKSFIKVA